MRAGAAHNRAQTDRKQPFAFPPSCGHGMPCGGCLKADRRLQPLRGQDLSFNNRPKSGHLRSSSRSKLTPNRARYLRKRSASLVASGGTGGSAMIAHLGQQALDATRRHRELRLSPPLCGCPLAPCCLGRRACRHTGLMPSRARPADDYAPF